MATLKMRKSANEVIELPLTTKKPIARSLAVFQDGKVYYCPLVHSGEYLDSGVKVRIGDETYALATQIYDPVTYDSSGRQWTVEGYPFVVGRNSVLLYTGKDYWTSPHAVSLTSSSSFSFSCSFLLSSFLIASQNLCEVYVTNNKKFFLGVQSDKKLKLYLITSSSSTTIIKTLSGVLNVDEIYSTEIRYNNGVWACNFDGEDLGTVSKSIPASDYYIRIGSNLGTGRGFLGYLYNVRLSFDNIESKLRFGY